MPNIKSAKKRVLVTAKKNSINKSNKSEVKTAIRKLNEVIDAGNYEEAVKLYNSVASLIDSSVSKGVITPTLGATILQSSFISP